MSRNEIITRVRAKIDEISTPDDLQLVNDVFAVIDENLEDSANSFLLKAPRWMLDSHPLPLHGKHRILQDGGGYVYLPDDFLRLYAFQMSEWNSPVMFPMDEEHPNYKLRMNRHLVNLARPLVAIIDTRMVQTDPTFIQQKQPKALEYRGVIDSHQIVKASYVKKVFRNEGHSVEDLGHRATDGIVWQSAIDFFYAIQQPQLAQALEQKLTEYFQFNFFGIIPSRQEN